MPIPARASLLLALLIVGGTVAGLLQPASAERAAPAGALARPNQAAQVSTVDLRGISNAFFVGAWETRNREFGRDVRIVWRLWPDGRLDYDFEVDGIRSRGATGRWEWRDGVMHEDWHRPDGSTGQGRGSVERIDDNTIRLTIIDNGAPEYRGKARVYRRLGPPQVSGLVR